MGMERTVEAFFVRAAECETRFAGIYENLSALCAGVPSVATFWDGFARDERHHADLIREIHRSLTQQQLSAPPADGQWKNLLAAEDLLEHPLLRSVKDLNDAYELAHEMENHELMLAFQLFVHEAIPDTRREAFMQAQLDEHIHRLEEMRTQWGSVATRKKVRLRNEA